MEAEIVSNALLQGWRHDWRLQTTLEILHRYNGLMFSRLILCRSSQALRRVQPVEQKPFALGRIFRNQVRSNVMWMSRPIYALNILSISKLAAVACFLYLRMRP